MYVQINLHACWWVCCICICKVYVLRLDNRFETWWRLWNRSYFQVAMMEPSAPAPTPPADVPAVGEGSLPSGYRSKRCKYCRTYSHARTPIPLGIFNAWDPLIPWADGKKNRPRGLVCRLCFNVPLLALYVYSLHMYLCMPHYRTLYLLQNAVLCLNHIHSTRCSIHRAGLPNAIHQTLLVWTSSLKRTQPGFIHFWSLGYALSIDYVRCYFNVHLYIRISVPDGAPI